MPSDGGSGIRALRWIFPIFMVEVSVHLQKSRYRQWITHKLATWIDQFGTSGCVGCGRCITWCPVAIDITEEVEAIRKSEPISERQTTEAVEKKGS